ncbi:hypothetical protein K469DRAFT_725593 [Zopfia rhizophila CBS 207.26]|uniref:Pentatricopeptide repeat protein n=1 Tax=Zopfia rhizophila CBS 207.26 TaxID=1314779 RepID=A0A6A6E567_9PEZI|nr:hypothetical protein K469DRAFT_725593 [Zopfia rhizophila CBS 207.26]
MLVTLRPKGFCRSLCPLPARALTTLPRKIPNFIPSWNPSTQGQKNKEEAAVGAYVVQDAEKEALKRAIWRAYIKSKVYDRDLPRWIPARAWDILWASQSVRSPMNRSREAHLNELYEDMRSVGQPVTVEQRIAYLEGMFFAGETDEALDQWEQDHAQSGAGRHHDYKPEHLEVGARMHAYVGNADRAREIMDELFDLYPSWDPTIMMAVLRAHTRISTEQHRDRAQKIYVRMKSLLGPKATLKDYDGWLVGFLEGLNLQYAKIVFKDMVADGHLAGNFSYAELTSVLRRLHLLYCLGTDIEKMTSICLHAISILPPPYHSHLFGDWMKLATVKRAPDASAQILELMFKRGLEPQTFHFNLLLKTLLRTKREEAELKAENIGWRMVEEFGKTSAEQTRSSSAQDAITKTVELAANSTPISNIERRIPPANVTTYGLLMQHHANHSQWEHVDYLRRRLKESEIAPNAEVMNVLMDNYCRQGKYDEVWEVYRTLTNVPKGTAGVFPNGASFRILWVTLRLALGDHQTREHNALPTPRQLVAETLYWWNIVRSRYDAKRFRMGLAAASHEAVNGLMMHCFSYTKDPPGSLVAMHALRKYFQIFPSNKAANTLNRQLAWIDLHWELPTVRAHYHHTGVHKRNLEKMAQVYHILMQNRFKRMNLTEDQFSNMSKEEVGDMNLDLLSEYVRVVLKRQYPPEEVEAMIDQAKQDMGVSDLQTGDLNAFDVA